ncbi:lycopene beta-cyclase CrtY [Novosphingobium colocasiae]|uniref:Lycopene cyclase n=1 Tax=Novosphingobium colocasiae TaxID=1256513 RepID=A0A918UIN0_9SPHN|nr:lycopene beta-cyclase CrtY [Novosphingobium colocasiae]GGZ14722.1 hypothetical protein GCM10011614_32070 [Novosphingobium colocasiae]
MPPRPIDLAVVGAGLAGGLIALAMRRRRPDLRTVLIERDARLGGNHVWSFFASDIAPADQALVEPLIVARWDGYGVRFPDFARRLGTPYRSVTGSRLDAVLREHMPAADILTGVAVRAVEPFRVALADGSFVEAGAVIDARGAGSLPAMAGGWQKFLGQMVRLVHPHGLTEPLVMDATVSQHDGFRFIYALPFTPDTIFLEDTYYSDDSTLDAPLLRNRIADYAAAQGWTIAAIEYEETGVLPVIAKGDLDRYLAATAGDCAPATARAGTRAPLLHPLTSYSFPDAVRFASYVSTLDNISGTSLGRTSHAWVAHHWRAGAFYRMLTRMLFGAARPDDRWRVLQRFYTLRQPLIERFYAGRSTGADKLRILAGRPPVPLAAACASLAGQGRPLADLGRPNGPAQ